MAKLSKAQVRGKARTALNVRFEEQSLTSFAGLVVFQELFGYLDIKQRLWGCFRHLGTGCVYTPHVIAMLLIVHLLLGYRELREVRYYRDDDMVKRLLGLKRLPDVATISRSLARADERAVEQLRKESRLLVIKRLEAVEPTRLTADFDGSVLRTGRHAEGTGVGFNKQKKGQRSYYPLFCTVAQTAQVLDVHHRPGNVHDSNGASDFMVQCMDVLHTSAPRARLETRMDSAFFSEDIIETLDEHSVEFSASVPFERLVALKSMVESRRRWRTIDERLSYFESQWKPKCWGRYYRFIFVRKCVHRQHKEPLQLDLFIPREDGYEFKVIVTNKRVSAKHVVSFHQGRGSQEGIFGELKTQCQMGHVPVSTRVGNQIYMYSAIIAHNVTRELQMLTRAPDRVTTAKRAALWTFTRLDTLRRNVIQRAGRLIRPNGSLVLSMSTNPAVEDEMLHYLGAIRGA